MTPKSVKLKADEVQDIKDWIKLNYDELMALWKHFETGEGSTIELLSKLKEANLKMKSIEQVCEQYALDWEREVRDTDALLELLNLDPENCRTDGGSLNLMKIKTLLDQQRAIFYIQKTINNLLVMPAVGWIRKQDALEYAPVQVMYLNKPAPENGTEPARLFSLDQIEVALDRALLS